MRVYDVPCNMQRLCRRVPLALSTAAVTHVVRAVHLYYSFGKPFIAASPNLFGLDLKSVATNLTLSYISVQEIAFAFAVIWNSRVYFRDSNALETLDWDEHLRVGATGQPAGWEGVSLEELRNATEGWTGFYMGAAVASMHVGSMFLSFLINFFVLMFNLMVVGPTFRDFFWTNFFEPLLRSGCSVLALIVLTKASTKCLWGDVNQFPRRLGFVVLRDVFQMMTGLFACVWTGFTRALKSLLGSAIGLLSVTKPGVYQGVWLRDAIHSYYLHVLRQERFKLEVDRGGISVQETSTSWQEFSVDFGKYMLLNVLLATCCTCLVVFLRSLVSGNV
mmetsp:Transcript_95318/g.291492  ORF Transcript_95318/g.291492 Transcript_95318/m.291492 type:complete len:333 (-) Transcript_95318:25-1023(-)